MPLTLITPPPPAQAAGTAAASAAPNVKVAGQDVPVPKRTRFVQPVFPPEAQAAGQRGIVILEIVIDESGKVSTADVLRSVAPFDSAALAAARQWEYEVTKVDGKPVPVRLTIPITFALKLPDMTREAGIPELRQGAAPAFPPGAKGPATVVADVTLLPDGTVAEAAIREGDSPWADAMLQTLRTWRFASDPAATPVAFQVRADFLPGPPAPRIDLRLSGLRTGERRAAEVASPPATPTPEITPAAPPATAAPEVVAPAPAPTPTPAGAGSPPVSAATPATPPPAVPPVAPSSPAPILNPPAAPPPRPEGVRPSPVATPPGTTLPSTAATPPPATATPPPIEVIPGGPPSATGVPIVPVPSPTPAPPEIGVSAVRDVTLGPGVPDLTKGRRPVAPPLARMSSVSGSVQVQFSVDAAGSTSLQNVTGHDLLKEAARQAVASWSFRRTSPERVYLVADFTYQGDRAQAEVRRAE
jgi:TonB family protein